MSSPNLKTKLKQGRGLGEGKDYRPFIKSREFNSVGTCSNITDWKHGRQMQLLSQTEYGIYMQQRWRDDVVDVREHFPLDMEYLVQTLATVNKELNDHGYKALTIAYHKGNDPVTTDMLLTLNNGSYEAISVKSDKNALSQREIEKLWIEKKYWNNKGIEFHLMDKTNINNILVNNIRLVTEYYDSNRVYDEISAIKHLIATKKLIVDMDSEIIDFTQYYKIIKQ